MSSAVLVTYVTRYGSTAEIAKEIATVLDENGLDVDLKPLREVKLIDPYRAIVVGMPLYLGHLPQEAHHFLSHFRDALVHHLTMIFAVGPIHAEAKEFIDAR